MYLRGGEYYGCLFSVGRPVPLGDMSARGNALHRWGDRNFQLAGRFVAFERYDTGQETAQWRVRAIDLQRGRQVFSVPTGQAPSDPGSWLANGMGTIVGAGPTTRLVVTPAGSVGWITSDQFYVDPTTGHQVYGHYEVRDANGSSVTVLDSGPAVQPDILVLTGGSLNWVDNGLLRSAPLG